MVAVERDHLARVWQLMFCTFRHFTSIDCHFFLSHLL